MLSLIREFWLFPSERKRMWMLPIVLAMLGALIVSTQGSAIAPFIHTLF